MSKKIYAIACYMLLVFTGMNVTAEEIRDFYAEPGLHPFKETIAHLNETVDPFSGILQLSHTDITIPGNGGMDINISRFYTNPPGCARLDQRHRGYRLDHAFRQDRGPLDS